MTTKAPVKTPERVMPKPQEKPKRYSPDTDHCPGQWIRTVRRIRKV